MQLVFPLLINSFKNNFESVKNIRNFFCVLAK